MKRRRDLLADLLELIDGDASPARLSSVLGCRKSRAYELSRKIKEAQQERYASTIGKRLETA